MHVASSEQARYDNNELAYVITPESVSGAIMSCPPAFDAAYRGSTRAWIAADQPHTQVGRADVLAAVAAPLNSAVSLETGSIGMIALEVLAGGTHDLPRKASAVKSLVEELGELVTTTSVEMQKFFLKDWP